MIFLGFNRSDPNSRPRADHNASGSLRPKGVNVIDIKRLERDFRDKPVTGFHALGFHALGRPAHG
jgi:hypothetical protein